MRPLIASSVAFVLGVSCFNTPLWAVIITGETAIATNPNNAFPTEDPANNRFAINVVNNSGITINSPNLAADGQITHDGVYQNMWTNEPGHGNNAAVGLTLTIDLGGGSDIGYDLSGMRIWNYNGSGGGADQGIDNYDLETSRDGVTWTLRQNNQALAIGTESSTYAGVYTAVNWLDVRYARLIVNTTERPFEDIGGLSEMMFEGTLAVAAAPIPEPSTGILLLLWTVGLHSLTRRQRCNR